MSQTVRPKTSRSSPTSVRKALKSESPLQGHIKDSLGAIEKSHRAYFDESIRTDFIDSIDIDKALAKGREQENRWDYLLGHRPTNRVIGIEPHSAKNDEISTVIRKLEAAKRQLKEHLCDGAFVSDWFWVASGKVHLAPFEKATIRLAQSGIKFIGRKLTNKDIST